MPDYVDSFQGMNGVQITLTRPLLDRRYTPPPGRECSNTHSNTHSYTHSNTRSSPNPSQPTSRGESRRHSLHDSQQYHDCREQPSKSSFKVALGDAPICIPVGSTLPHIPTVPLPPGFTYTRAEMPRYYTDQAASWGSKTSVEPKHQHDKTSHHHSGTDRSNEHRHRHGRSSHHGSESNRSTEHRHRRDRSNIRRSETQLSSDSAKSVQRHPPRRSEERSRRSMEKPPARGSKEKSQVGRQSLEKTWNSPVRRASMELARLSGDNKRPVVVSGASVEGRREQSEGQKHNPTPLKNKEPRHLKARRSSKWNCFKGAE